jgi:peptidoglycan LD-endopeptidase CwlK
MSYVLGPRSLEKLTGVHPDLVRVIQRAIEITPIDFAVTEGIRTLARQKQLLVAGATTTLKSRHLTGHAVDVAPYAAGKLRWDWPLFDKLAPAIKQAAVDCGVEIEWGGDWENFKDGPHFQLPWSTYP